MKRKISIIIGLLTAIVSIAQEKKTNYNPYPDTLELETDSKVKMTFAFNEMRDQQQYISNELWQSMLGIMGTALDNSDKEEGIIVSYRVKEIDGDEYAKVEVRPLEVQSDIYLIGAVGMEEKLATRIEFEIYQPKFFLSFSLNKRGELDDIKEINIESVWDQLSQKYEERGKRNIYSGEGVIKYGNANVQSIQSERGGTDMLELSAGVGIGYYRDRFIPDLGFKLGFNLPDRFGNIKVQTGLLYTQQYLFESGPEQSTMKPNINGFLNGFFNLRYGSGNEVGLGIGYLIHREGGFYEGETFKLSAFTQKAESKFTFTPELVFSNDFKQVFPALRLGFTF